MQFILYIFLENHNLNGSKIVLFGKRRNKYTYQRKLKYPDIKYPDSQLMLQTSNLERKFILLLLENLILMKMNVIHTV